MEKCDIIPAPSTDHSAITLSFNTFENERGGPSFWKFNNSLIENERYIVELKNIIQDLKTSLDRERIQNPQLRWELIKYEIRKFLIIFSKELARNRKKAYQQLESEIKNIENKIEWEKDELLYAQHDNLLKSLEVESNYITEGIIIRSKATWYEQGEKSTKYFLNLERRNKTKTHVRKLNNDDGTETTDPNEILRKIKCFFSIDI